MLTGATIASLTFASFAGCSADDPTPSGSPTPRANTGGQACTPQASTIAWSDFTRTGSGLVGDYVLDYLRDPGSEPYYVAEALPITWDTAELGAVVGTGDALDDWKSALLVDAVNSGRAAAGFGRPVSVADPSTPPIQPSRRANASYLVSVRTAMLRASFTVRCRSGSVQGSLTPPDPSHFIATLYRCGDPIDGPSTAISAGELARCPRF